MTFPALVAAAVIRTSIILAGAYLISRFVASAGLRHRLFSYTLLASCIIIAVPTLNRALVLRLPESLDPHPRFPQIDLASTAALPEQGAPASALTFAVRPPAHRPLVYLWLAGALITVVWFTRGHIELQRLRRRGRPLDDERFPLPRQLADGLGVHNVEFLLSNDDIVPLVIGELRPAVVLPQSASRWSSDRWRAVLLHELSHIRRRDGLSDRVAEIACVLYWFHPLVWLTARRLRTEREIACDADVIESGMPRTVYAEQLVQLAGELRYPFPAGFRTVAHGASLPRRINALLQPTAQSRRYAGAGLLALCLIVVVSLVVSADYRQAEDAKQIAEISRYLHHQKRSEDDFVRERAVWALSRIKHGRIVEPLIAELKNPDWRVRSYAAWALALTQDARGTLPLIGALEDDHWRVRGHAAFALDEINDRRALPAMRRALSDPVWQVRIDAVEFVARHGGTSDRALLEPIQRADPHPKVRKEATEELAKP